MNTEKLFTPFTLNGVTLANRVAMAPMTRNHSPGGVPGPDVAAYYRRRAEGGAGLIITEGTAPNHPEAKNMPDVPHMYGEEALAGWTRVVEAVHAAGGRIFSQLVARWRGARTQRAKASTRADQSIGIIEARYESGRADDARRDRRDDCSLRTSGRKCSTCGLRWH